jgi:hypothetical protein
MTPCRRHKPDEFAITNNIASNNKSKYTKVKPRPSKQ